MQYTFTIPKALVMGSNQWAVVGLLVIAGLCASVVVEAYKRHYNSKRDVDLAKHWVAALLTLVSALFAYIGYVAIFLQSNQSLLSGFPFVGKHVEAVVGIAWSLYAFRLNKTYQVVADYLAKWSNKKPAVKTVSTPVVPDSFVG